MQIVEHPTEIHVSIPYDRFRVRNTNAIKQLDGSRFDWTRKAWIVPMRYKERLQIFCQKIKGEWINALPSTPQLIGDIKPMPELNIEIDIINRDNGFKPRPYQLQGMMRTIQLQRVINGDEPGLGKSLQSLGSIYVADKYFNKPVYPCLVICPSALKINWAREWEMWTGKKAMILDNKNKDTWHRFFEMGMNDIFIVNYESMKKFFVKFYPPKGKMKSSNDIIMDERINIFKSVIIDESHRLKDPKTQQTKIALQIAIRKEWCILLSGTPVVNKPVDLFPQLAIMNRLNDFGGKKHFMWRYCEGGKGSSNLKELNYLLNDKCFFRREKKDVVEDLPDKQRQTILCDISTRNEYNKAKHDFVKFLTDNGATDAEIARKLRGEIMVKMGELKKISAKGKMNEVKDFVQDIIESGEKLILFCTLHSIVDEVLKLFPDAVTVTGRDNEESKQRAVDKFQKDPNCKLIVCNIKAAGVGITLTASSRVAFIEYPWTYADCVQCEDRAHRIGQKNSVMCTYFLGNNTIDEDLYRMIQEKRHTANAITGATDEMEMNFVDSVVSLFTK